MSEQGSHGLKFYSCHDMINREMRTEWLIKDYLDTGKFAVMFGEAGTMKSFCALDMGLCIATGTDWHGRSVKKSGPVFYVAGEGFIGIGRRLKAWCHKHNITADDVPFYVSNRAIDMFSSEAANQAIEVIQKMTKESGSPALVILDTLNRNFGGGDENSSRDMTWFVHISDRMKGILGCTLLVIHHSGLKDKGRSRGSNALHGALDWEYRMDDKQGQKKLVCTKVKDHEEPPFVCFEHQVIDLGYEDDGYGEQQKITSVVLNEVHQKVVKLPRPKLKDKVKTALDVLKEHCSNEGQKTIHLDVWRDAFKSKLTGMKEDSKRKAFDRARKELISSKYVEAEGDVFWLADKPDN